MRLNELWLRDARVCQLCLEDVVWAEASRDHKVPKAHKGRNNPENLHLAHVICNNFRDVRGLDAISAEAYRANRRLRLANGPVARDQIPPKMAPSVPKPAAWRCAWCGGNNYSRMERPAEGHSYRECSHCLHRRYAELPGDPIG